MPDDAVINSLYVHVPFCVRKCAYCAFYSEAGDGALVNRYVGALIREMEMVAAELRPRTVFFGGGTPSLLNLRQWEAIFAAMDRLGLLGAAEWTVECNPATVSADKARLLRDRGVNRVSMGVQSFDPAMLERLGRVHSREMIFKSFDVLRAAETMRMIEGHDRIVRALERGIGAPQHQPTLEIVGLFIETFLELADHRGGATWGVSGLLPQRFAIRSHQRHCWIAVDRIFLGQQLIGRLLVV